MRLLLTPFNRLIIEIKKLIDKDYIKKKLEKRTGECRKCGKCCKGCKFLDVRTNLCRTYKNRPRLCYKDFPLDNTDKWIWKTKNCGYNFS